MKRLGNKSHIKLQSPDVYTWNEVFNQVYVSICGLITTLFKSLFEKQIRWYIKLFL